MSHAIFMIPTTITLSSAARWTRELVINLKTVQALDLTIPEVLLESLGGGCLRLFFTCDGSAGFPTSISEDRGPSKLLDLNFTCYITFGLQPLLDGRYDLVDTVPATMKALRLVTTQDGNSVVSLSVQDSGPGINPENATHVFDQFLRRSLPGRDWDFPSLGRSSRITAVICGYALNAES